MKLKLLLIAIIALSYNFSDAQTELWGTTSEGGKYGAGTIYKTDGNGDNFEIQHSFFYTVGQSISSPLTEASEGKLFGLASEAAVCSNFGGVIYEYNISTDSYDVKYSFEDSENGNYPIGKLLYANNGKLYGVTRDGGANDKGVIFEFDPSSDVFAKIFDFGGDNGSYPSSLMQAQNGKLYGVTKDGGTEGEGLIYEFDISNNTYTKLFDFDDDNGSAPTGVFVEVSTNKLYGVTKFGGGNYYGGTIYEFDISTNTHTVKKVLASYDISIGGAPSKGLTLADNGKLYGTVFVNKNSIGAKLFEYNIDTETYTLLNVSGSQYLGSELFSANNGNLYGTGGKGGSDNKGVIFEYNISTQIITSLYSFTNDDDSGYGSASLIQASNNKLYACTGSGGESLWGGGLYEFDIATTTYTKKFDFDVSKLGSNPSEGLIQASNNKLYGMTRHGGIYVDSDLTNDRYGAGTIFEFDPSTSKYKVLFEFDGNNGKLPQGALLQATNDKLYGLTYSGGDGDSAWGVMFEYDINSGSYKVLYNFDINGDRENGANPSGTLMQADNGKLYGFTSRGGVLADGTRVDNGTMFEYDIDSETLTTIHAFNDIDGKIPSSKLIQARNETLYGLTASGGGYNMMGTLFSFDTNSDVFTKLYSFSKTGNYNPLGALTEVIINDGINLFGVTSAESGDNDAIFKYNVQEEELIFVKEFDGNDNYNPLYTTLFLASNGNLYGAGPIKGTEHKFLFQYNIEEELLEPKFDFTCKKNSNVPLYIGGLIEIDANYLSAEEHIDIIKNNYFVYPNPTTDVINIKSDTDISKIEIYNQQGQLVLSSNKNQNVDVSILNSSIYIVKIITKNGGIETKKLIKK